MAKTYLIIYAKALNREEMVSHLESTRAIEYWEYCLPYSIIVRTTLTAKDLSELLEKKYGKLRHFITRVSKNDYHGRLPKEYWDIFYNQDD